MLKTWVDERVRTPAGRQQIRLEISECAYPLWIQLVVEADMADIEKASEWAA